MRVVIERPLRGEPLSLDLVNTEWIDGGDHRDLFEEAGGVSAWLAEHGYQAGHLESTATALRQARAALRAALERGEHDSLNAVLAHGTRTPVLGPDGPGEIVHVDPDWRPAWEAAVDYLRLLGDRLRRCAHPACVLYFYDTSRNGTRRWCSMDVCGNRAKAGRHYARARRAAGA